MVQAHPRRAQAASPGPRCPPIYLADLEKGKQVDSKAAADRYVTNLRDKHLEEEPAGADHHDHDSPHHDDPAPPPPRPGTALLMQRDPVVAVRRTTELGLLVLAGVITAGAYVLAALGRSSSLPANLVPFLLIILGLLVAAHFAVRRLAPGADPLLLPLAGLLNGIGYVFIARLDPTWPASSRCGRRSASAPSSPPWPSSPAPATSSASATPSPSFGIGLLLMPLLPGARPEHQRRPPVGEARAGELPAGRAGQDRPGRVLRLLPGGEAGAAVDGHPPGGRRCGCPRSATSGPIVLAWGFSLVIMFFEKDLGSSLLFFALFITMLWVATARGVYLGIGGIMFAVGAILAYTSFDHVRTRVSIWIDPWTVANDAGYQIVQALFAFAAGGLAGTNLGQGSPQRIPAVATDFIFAAIGEELGLLGTVAVLVGFLLMVGAGLRIAMRAEPPVREAAGRRAHRHPRHPELHHPGRGHPPGPPHRHHPAVRLLRRVVADLQLHPAGPAPAHLRRPGPPGGPGRRGPGLHPAAAADEAR